MAEVVSRAMKGVDRICRRHEGQLIAAVTHGDVIRGILVHALGMPLDLLHRLEVQPASVNVLRIEAGAPRVLAINWRAGEGPVQLA
jgi:probable phosphoglycerate mutase